MEMHRKYSAKIFFVSVRFFLNNIVFLYENAHKIFFFGTEPKKEESLPFVADLEKKKKKKNINQNDNNIPISRTAFFHSCQHPHPRKPCYFLPRSPRPQLLRPIHQPSSSSLFLHSHLFGSFECDDSMFSSSRNFI